MVWSMMGILDHATSVRYGITDTITRQMSNRRVRPNYGIDGRERGGVFEAKKLGSRSACGGVPMGV